MCKQSLKSSQEGLRIMVEPDLVEHGAPIVVDAFTRELPLFIECEKSAQRELHRSTCGWETAPGAEVGTADANFECNAILSCQSVHYVDVEIGKRNEQILIVAANCDTTVMVFTPRFIVVPRLLAKGGHDSWQVVGIFSMHVLLDDL